MKKTLIVTSSLFASVSALSAYTVVFQNYNAGDGTAVPILDNTGTPIANDSGFISAVYFDSVPDLQSLVNDPNLATSFGSSSAFVEPLAGTEASGGFASVEFSSPIPEGTATPPVGQRLYILIGNGADIASSNLFAILDTQQDFGTENAAGQGGLDVTLTSAVLEPGDLVAGNFVQNYAGIIEFEEAIQLVAAIPEPSTSLLAALAGLGLVARRRR